MIRSAAWSGLAALGFLLSVAAPAAAEEALRVERVPIAEVPVVEVEPEVQWKSFKWGKPQRSALPDEERARPTRAWGAEPRPRRARGQGNAAVVRIRNNLHPEDHESNQWLRFVQSGGESPLSLACNAGGGDPRGVDAYLLEASAEDGPWYTYTEAWMDPVACAGLALRGYRTRVAPIAGGIAYAYRAHCDACAPEQRDRLHVILPTGRSTSVEGEGTRFRYWTYLFEHLELPLSPGTAGTLNAQIDAASILAWNRVIPTPFPGSSVEIRVEVSHSTAEPEPTILYSIRPIELLPLAF